MTILRVLLILALACGSSVLEAQSSSTPGAADAVAAAESAFAHGRWQTAADGYAMVLARDSANGRLWYQLGASLEPLQRWRDAAAAYTQARRLDFQPLGSELRLARASAHLGETSQALAHLRAAAAIGFAPALIASEPAFEPLRDRPEYREILALAEATRFPCRAVHTFDYWAGDFDVSYWDQPGAALAHTHNVRAYDGCVIVEDFTSPGRLSGMSMSFYDTSRHTWRMVWDSDANSSNDFEGTFRDGGMHFLGWVLDPSGQRLEASNTLLRVSPDTIHQTYAVSADSGKTWVIRSNLRYVRREGP